MKKFKFLPILIIFLLTAIFFKSFILQGKLPIPSDTIVGLYYPFRDIYFKTNPNGIPFKNFLVTDPVRQQYPWRNLVINQEKSANFPLWNPYNLAGTPLLANFQAAAFYPFNILFFILPFSISWSILIFLQPFFAGVFLYFYLRNLKVKTSASLLGGVTFSFSGFFIAWMQWGTVLNTALWLPLILLSVDKLFVQLYNFRLKNQQLLIWFFALTFSFVFSFLAGHLQTFFYVAIVFFAYFLTRLLQYDKSLKALGLLSAFSILFIALTFVQWFPTMKFIMLSARDLDVVGWKDPGWFVPWQNLIQFLSPDFFGNPATLNYYGIWNYAEFVGYIGIVPLIMAFFALFFRKDRKTLFFGMLFFLSLIFALPTIFANFPFKLNLPFIATSQPTRLLFITDFSLSVLAAFGFDYFVTHKNKKLILYVLGFFLLIFALLWLFVLLLHGNIVSPENLTVSKQNLILPTVLFAASAFLIIMMVFPIKKIHNNLLFLNLLSYFLILIVVVDLFRFGWKFEPFTSKEYLYPSEPVVSFLQGKQGVFRIMSDDSRILPPNFSVMYKLQTLDGYDPLYLRRYGELMAAYGRGKPDINPPFGFNRIITPQDSLSRLTDLMGVKYVLSLDEVKSSKLKQVFTDGIVKVYENETVLPRAFFVNNTLIVNSKEEAINAMYDLNHPLDKRVTVEDVSDKSLFKSNWDLGKAEITRYEDNKVTIDTSNSGDGFLVLTDSFYPTWHAKIDGKETKIYLTDFNFRGIIVSKGKHIIEFYNTLF